MEFFKSYKEKPNKELFDMMTNLKIEFDKTKSLLIGLTHHLDDIEKKFNLVESELKKRKVS
ncbi:hypothetical protein N9322_01380 [bacterium]|jgi:hypothetical protein|nr:hypothetical protein [bacterium]|tara:strand:+ start:1149 stop:1331 length:183 start_codon:yes stop_codon:yes gene_type:complete